MITVSHDSYLPGVTPYLRRPDNTEDGTSEVCNLGGPAYYCCKAEVAGEQLCGWSSGCFSLDDDEQPQGDPCSDGRKFITYRKGNCDGESNDNSWNAFCCAESIEDPKCY
jgi:hypothetical protein